MVYLNKTTKVIVPITIIGCLIIIIYNFSPLMGLEQKQEITISHIQSSDTSSEKSSSEKKSKAPSKKASSKKSSSKSSKKESSKKSSSKSSSEQPSSSYIDDSNIKLDINNATIEQLIEINGINQKLAENIVEFRNKIGEFFKVTELLNVKDMTYEILTEIQDNLYINEKE